MSDRLTVHDPSVIQHVVTHPARGKRFTNRELATKLGTNSAVISRLRTGQTTTVDAELGRRLAVAVGVHPNVLFVPRVFPDPHTRSQIEGKTLIELVEEALAQGADQAPAS